MRDLNLEEIEFVAGGDGSPDQINVFASFYSGDVSGLAAQGRLASLQTEALGPVATTAKVTVATTVASQTVQQVAKTVIGQIATIPVKAVGLWFSFQKPVN